MNRVLVILDQEAKSLNVLKVARVHFNIYDSYFSFSRRRLHHFFSNFHSLCSNSQLIYAVFSSTCTVGIIQQSF